MKKVYIILAIIVIYALIGIFAFRDTVDTEVGFAGAYIGEQRWVVGKTLDGSYHYGEVIVYQDDSEVFRYQTHYQNSLYRNIIFDHNMAYILGYQFTKDNIINNVFITRINTDFEVLDETQFTIDGELYPTSILASEDAIYILASYTGTNIGTMSLNSDGEYDLLILECTKNLEIISIYSYGESLSDLVSDAYIYEENIVVSYNEFDSLVEGNETESNQGKLITFNMDSHIFTELDISLESDKLRIQGLISDTEEIGYFGNYLDADTQLMTPYLCLGETCEIFRDLDVNANIIDVIKTDNGYVCLLDFEQYGYSQVYGDITRNMILILNDDFIRLQAIDKDIYVEQLSQINESIYLIGYEVEHHVFRADRTKYYDEILYVEEMNN